MAWESVAIGLLTDALKSVLGRIMESGQERRAAQLISEATRELLLEHPHIEEVKSMLLEAEKLLKTPSPQLLHAQSFLDRVTKDYESAQHALERMRSAYLHIGSVQGIAYANGLSGMTWLETGNYAEAIKSFQQAFQSYLQIGDRESIMDLFPHLLEAYLHEDVPQAQKFLKENLETAISMKNLERQFTTMISLGVSANSTDFKLLAIKAFSTAWAIDESERLWSQINELADSLSLSTNQLNKIMATTQVTFKDGNIDELVIYLFNNEQ